MCSYNHQRYCAACGNGKESCRKKHTSSVCVACKGRETENKYRTEFWCKNILESQQAPARYQNIKTHITEIMSRFVYCLRLAGCLLGSLFRPKDRSNIFLRNFCELIPEDSTIHSRRYQNFKSSLLK